MATPPPFPGTPAGNSSEVPVNPPTPAAPPAPDNTPESTPESAPEIPEAPKAPTPPEAPAFTGSQGAAVQPANPGRKKNNTTLIIIIVIAVVLLLAGAGVGLFFYLSKKAVDRVYDYHEELTELAEEFDDFDDINEDFHEQVIEEVPVVEEEVYAEENVWKDGRNVLIGTFVYQGSKYGFTITLDYHISTGRITNATYEAHGYGKASKLSVATLSSDCTALYLSGQASGTETMIDVTASPGSSTYTGNMIRGDHAGECTLTLQ